MQIQSLNGIWLLRQYGAGQWLPSQAPGDVHTALLAAGRIPDPFEGQNEAKVQWVAEKDWEYRRYFHPTPTMLAQDTIFLTCLGLDTLAEVRLNGKILGVAANMFRAWQWEVKKLLQAGENRLDIRFRSPLAHIRQRQRVNPLSEMPMGIRGRAHLRKAPSHFGWDWGPRLPVTGIWKEVRLEGWSSARLLDVRFEQQHENGMVRLNARIQSEIWGTAESARSFRLRVTGPDRQVWQADAPARPQQMIPLIITDPQLWWPNGLGEQPLYRVELDLIEEDRVLDSRSLHLGLRTIALARNTDAHGESFAFVVNGTPVFAKGANWVPPDSFPTQVGQERLEHLVRSAAGAHQNMLRVWGGGYYESDAFYDLCDRHGILVWQDFPFACATYPLDDPAYLESVRGEVVDNVRRLRHHASLALWCGSNEIEWLWQRMGWARNNPGMQEAHRRFFRQQLPELLAEEDPGRPYWPGSPSSGQAFEEPNSSQRGDAHLWEVYHNFKPPAFYRQQNPRFASEFGFQSLPAAETVSAFAAPEEQRLGSPVMRARQRSAGGNPKLLGYLGQRFRLPRAFNDLIYLSQVFQAEAVRTAVEHWRRQPERTAGALFWQLNDCCPAISWSSIDYHGRWKALHYAARRFNAPVLLSIEETRANGQNKAALWVSNDTCATWQGRLRWTLETLDGQVLEGGEQPVRVAALSADCALRQDFAPLKRKIDWRKTVLTAELWQDDARLALQVVGFVADKHLRLGRPGLQTRLASYQGGLGVEVSARKLARFVELSFTGAGGAENQPLFADNYFDLPAGRTVTVPCSLPSGWTEEQARAALQARSLGEMRQTDPLALSDLRAGWARLSAISAAIWQSFILLGLRR